MSADFVRAILREARLPPAAARGVEIQRYGQLFASRYPIGEAAAVALAACSHAATELTPNQVPRSKEMPIDFEAAALSLQSCVLVELNGVSPMAEEIPTLSPITGLYACADGRWIAMAGSESHQRAGILHALGCEEEAEAIAESVRTWSGLDLETTLVNFPAAMVRTGTEWVSHEQGRALELLPIVEIEQVSSEGIGPVPMSLQEIRVLDLTRVLAGPVCARTLADYGANVLHLSHPGRPEPRSIFLDTSPGKRDAFMDFDVPGAIEEVYELVSGADVVITNIRTRALLRRRLDMASLLRRRPGLVFASINCYGHVGPWKDRPGYEVTARAATGLNAGEGSLAEPQPVPGMICDYVTGYLAAYGVMVALKSRGERGGSWQVRTSLAQVGMWIERLGRLFESTKCVLGLVDSLGRLPPRYERVFDSTVTDAGVLRSVRRVTTQSSDRLNTRRTIPRRAGEDTASW
jgi:crotonobetainyl-CoA:carnitine CoA-transferase CaiB-like acyl-CoA transferase